MAEGFQPGARAGGQLRPPVGQMASEGAGHMAPCRDEPIQNPGADDPRRPQRDGIPDQLGSPTSALGLPAGWSPSRCSLPVAPHNPRRSAQTAGLPGRCSSRRWPVDHPGRHHWSYTGAGRDPAGACRSGSLGQRVRVGPSADAVVQKPAVHISGLAAVAPDVGLDRVLPRTRRIGIQLSGDDRDPGLAATVRRRLGTTPSRRVTRMLPVLNRHP